MSNNNFFNWGYPSAKNERQFGLWEPVLDRFLVIVVDPEIINDLRMVASSRYLLFACDLSLADNYTPELIDNSCCENWTLSNKKDIRFSKLAQHNTPTPVCKLIANTTVSDWNIDLEKTWLQFVSYCLSFIKGLKQSQGNWYFYSKFIKNVNYFDSGHEQDYYDHIDATERFILKSLHLGNDVDTVYNDISNFIKSTDATIFKLWQGWKKHVQ